MILLVSAILIVTVLPSTNYTTNESHPASNATTGLTTSENFIARSARPSDLQPIVKSAEAWRAHLAKKWSASEAGLEWRPRCEIVIHLTRVIWRVSAHRPLGAPSFALRTDELLNDEWICCSITRGSYRHCLTS